MIDLSQSKSLLTPPKRMASPRATWSGYFPDAAVSPYTQL